MSGMQQREAVRVTVMGPDRGNTVTEGKPELALDNHGVSVIKCLPMNTNRFFTAYNFYFWFGFYFRPSARVSL